MNIEHIINAWQSYLCTVAYWQSLITDIQPITNGCGSIYEIANPLDIPNTSIAIADMRAIPFTQPHYHPIETEIYYCLQGSGIVVVGSQEIEIQKGSVVIVPPDTAHFTVPINDLVLAVLNVPAFKPENYVPLQESNSIVQFDLAQFQRLTA